jgi:hypothetical protein
MTAAELKAMPLSRLQTTGKRARAAYRNERVAQMHEQTVEGALKQQVRNKDGALALYRAGDMLYDIRGGLLVLTASS